jgi:cytochrome d ubiquinol oxidase subunit I
MAVVLASGAWLAWRRRLEVSRHWLAAATWAFVLPALAIQLGWATAEIGRQPWIVYGLMRTDEATSPVVSAPEIAFSMLIFGAIYALLASLWLFLMRRAIREGPVQEPEPVGLDIGVSVRLHRPMEVR